MTQINNRTRVEISRNERVTYQERRILWGLVKWWVKVSAEKMHDDLFIETEWKIDSIYLNGVRIK